MSDVADLHYLTDTLTWWQRTGISGGGDPVFASPVAIAGRWRVRNDVFRSRDGSEKTSRAVVPVDRDLASGDYLLNGTSTNADPYDAGALLVDGWLKEPSIGGGRYIRRAFLI